MSASVTFLLFLFASTFATDFSFSLPSQVFLNGLNDLNVLNHLNGFYPLFETVLFYLKPYSFQRCKTAWRIASVGSATSPRKFSLIVRSSISFEVTPSAVAEGSRELVMPRGITYMSVAG